MKIGIVTTWFERGASYVSSIYMQLLEKEGHEVYIYARGGENHESQYSEKWNKSNVTRDMKYLDSKISHTKMNKWIKKNRLEAIFFNEQKDDYSILIYIKRKFPQIKIAAYVDYYTEDTLSFFDFYDFLICNTHRHIQAMISHQQKYYIPWGTDINLYKNISSVHEKITFFHSVGMSSRKGTDILVAAYIEGECYKKSKLIIHTQIPIERVCNLKKEQLEMYGIQIIEKTVPAPGLYYLGDVYVYPTRLDGLGLTMYEALSSGLPMITTNFPPMNEVGDSSCVKFVEIEDYYCRADAYFFPLVICDKKSLIQALNWYMDNPEQLEIMKKNARNFAEKHYDITKQSRVVSDVFLNSSIKELDNNLVKKYKRKKLIEFSFVKAILNLRIVDKVVIIIKNIIWRYYE